MATQAQPQNQPSPGDLNMAARKLVLKQSVEMIQSIYSQTIATPATNGPVIVQPRNVGLIKKFIVVLSGTVSNTDGALALNLTDLGLANLLSNVTFTDLNNNQRINTTGAHLAFLNRMKYRNPYAGTFALGTASDASVSMQSMFGTVQTPWTIIAAKPTLAFGTNAPFRAVYEIPLAYSDEDLRGAIYSNVVNATQQLSLTINTGATAFAAAAADTTTAVYSGTVNGTFTNVKVTVYQVYLDQLPTVTIQTPQGPKVQPILPNIDGSTIYELKSTPFTAIPAGQNFPIPYANFRDFLSTIVVYNNNGTTRAAGSDINFWALQAANFTNIWQIEPLLAAQFIRQIVQCDLPAGVYYFSHRKKPISTLQFGNMQLILNAITAAAGAYATVYWESFALTTTLQNAGSLAAS